MVGRNSANPKPFELDSPICKRSPLIGTEESVFTDCYLVPVSGADIRMAYYPTQRHWKIVDSSEIIEFSGCDYDKKILVCGRFYYQNDLLVGDTICPKKKGFIEWADRIFRTTKKRLPRSKGLDARGEKMRRNGEKRVANLYRP